MASSDHSSHSLLVLDLGLFVELAGVLAPSFKNTFYWSPGVESPFPKSNALLIGEGLPGVKRVNEIWDVLRSEKQEDLLILCTDVGYGPLQVYLREEGWRVWGAGKAEELELYRPEAKRHMKALGIAIGPYKVVKGINNLRAYLKDHEKQWVKVSRVRGDFETFFAKNYEFVAPKLDELQHTLGAMAAILEFVCEDDISPACEMAYDGFSIDGQYPESALFGLEAKDKGYLGHFVPYPVIPQPVRDANEKIAPTLRQYQCRSQFGMEGRQTRDGSFYVVDPLARFGSPPGELLQVMIENQPDVYWYGAEGQVVNPICTEEGRWGAELLIHSGWADKNWQQVEIPKSIRPYVKLRNLTIIDGEYYSVPQSVGLPEIGAVVACGKTKQEAIDKVKERAQQVQGYFVETYDDALDDVEEACSRLKSYGYTL